LGIAIAALIGVTMLSVLARRHDHRSATGATLDARLAQGELDARHYRQRLESSQDGHDGNKRDPSELSPPRSPADSPG
jgi:hypothetical protein